ncbi:unnamed protein product [Parajaminaea phylloscopi]
MDDDGLMLNFAPASAQSRQQPAAGPSQRSARKRSTNTAPAASLDEGSSTGQKRVRTDSRARPVNAKSDASDGARSGLSVRQKPNTFISSLFSGPNAAAVDVSAEEDAHEDRLRRKAQPTNAPADTSTFAGLGLDPLLVAHLSGQRMNIGHRPTGVQRTALPALLNADDSRDALVHAQTGSGKTLTYLLPIIQSLLPLCTETWIDRSVGTLAIILAPTRELARQIYEVAEKLCQLHLSVKQEAKASDDDSQAPSDEPIRRTRWLVPGLLSGGSTKNHEKSRLRKGIPILVATPGRLLDHLQNTSSFEVGKCRWLVLDEADRLLEMGFKETLEGIIKAMDGRRRLAYNIAKEAMQESWGQGEEVTPQDVEDGTGTKWWAHPRKVVLCSATLDENVQTLAGTHLRKPQVLRGGSELAPENPSAVTADEETETAVADSVRESSETTMAKTGAAPLYPRLAAPAQLRQNAVVIAPKLRLVTLVALLRSALARNSHNRDARRVIVFLSCTDSVEFLWNALGGVKMGEAEATPGDDVAEEDTEEKKREAMHPEKQCELFPGAPVYRLHGSLSQAERIASLKSFSSVSAKGSASSADGAILLCTSVAARGLDLPAVGCVIQLDPPTEGGVDEYLHRIGRTARVGKEGESWILFLPHEKEARARLEAAMQRNSEDATLTSSSSSGTQSNAATSSVIAEVSADLVLKRGFGGRGDEYESRATDVQLAFERWVLKRTDSASLARKAFLSHIRAYATHPTEEKDLFHVRFLHLGHLAKSFALREAPDAIKSNARKDALALAASTQTAQAKARGGHGRGKALGARAVVSAPAVGDDDDVEEEGDVASRSRADDLELARTIAKGRRSGGNDLLQDLRPRVKNGKDNAEARMYAKVRELGRQTKSGGTLAAYGASEFQIA